MKKLLLLLLCTCMQAAFAQSGKIDWKADLEFLTKELPEKHCNFFTIVCKKQVYLKMRWCSTWSQLQMKVLH